MMGALVDDAALRQLYGLALARVPLAAALRAIRQLLSFESADPVAENRLEAKAILLEEAQEALAAEADAVRAAAGTVPAPSAAWVAALEQRSREIDRLLATARTADALLELAGEAVELAAGLRSPSLHLPGLRSPSPRPQDDGGGLPLPDWQRPCRVVA